MPYLLIGALLATSVTVAMADEQATYARPELLVEVEELHAHQSGTAPLTDRPLTMIDVRDVEDFGQAAIPTAEHVDVAEWKAGFGDGTEAKAWSERIGSVLVDPESTVIVYDQSLTGSAARVWWILKYWGVEDVRILNGGFAAWRNAGGKVVEPQPRNGPPISFTAIPDADRLATMDEVQQLITGSKEAAALVDCRTDEEVDRGAIPSSNHLDWQALVDPETAKMKPAGELQQLLAQAGFDPGLPAVTYCQSGGRAAVMAFAMELMGGEEVANYYGSWGEWSMHHEPADRGPQKE